MFEIPWNVIAMQFFFGIALGCIFVLLSSGMSIIFGLLDVVNFAHGTFAMLGAYAVFVVVSLTGNFFVGLVSAVIIVGIIGMFVESFSSLYTGRILCCRFFSPSVFPWRFRISLKSFSASSANRSAILKR